MKALYRKICILLTVSILSTTFLTTVVGLFNANRLIQRDSHQIVKLISDSNADKINFWFESIESTVNVLYSFAVSQLPVDKDLWSDKTFMDSYISMMTDVLENAALNTESAMSVYLRINPELLSYKTGVWLVKNSHGEYENTELTDLALYKSTDRERVGWWYEPIAHQKPLWLLPYYNKNLGKEMVSYVIPIFIQNNLIGIIGMDIDYEKIKEKIAAISFFETGDAMLLNKNNEIVFSERFEILRKKDNYNLEIERIKSLKKFNFDAVSESHSIKMFGENIRFSSRDLVNGMKLVIMVPEEEINKDRKLMIIQCLIIIMIGLFISILICANITNKMEKVLGKITSSVQEIAKGNYEISVDVEEKNEFGELAKSFNEAAREFDRSNKQINKLAYTDSLTGLKNRHCFNKFCLGLEASMQKNIGVIFCDLNRLKFTNDNYGHEAGDKLICTFANLLKENFPSDECFRMSGDEFIVVSLGLSETHFEQFVKDFIAVNNKNEIPFAAIGYCWAISTANLNFMVNEAEANMYRDKNEFYKRFPEFKR